MIYQILFILFVLPFFIVRWSRWLAIVQQKEYRIDRLLSFLKSKEGQQDFWRLQPHLKDFTKTGFKRPIKTLRILIVAFVSAFVMIAFIFFIQQLLLDFLLLYFFLPFLLIFSCAPTSFASHIITLLTLFRAQQKLKKGKPIVMGVGGSYGKTSTKHLLAHVLSQKFSVFVTPKSHNTKYSVAKSILAGYHNQHIALLEYGTYTVGEIRYLTKWFPVNMAIETGFTLQHFELFGSKEKSIQAESELIQAVPRDGKVFCNGADEGARKIVETGNSDHHASVLFYGSPNASAQLTQISLNEKGELHFFWNRYHVFTKLVGAHYATNIQAVITVSKELGLTDQEILKGLESFQPSSSFILSRRLAQNSLLIDDGGTSNPMGFAAAITLADQMSQSHRILISSGIVDLGEKSHAVHEDLARQAKNVFSQVLYFGIDGRTEFEEAFGGNCTSDAQTAKEWLKNISDTLIVIEGRIPKWIDAQIQEMK